MKIYYSPENQEFATLLSSFFRDGYQLGLLFLHAPRKPGLREARLRGQASSMSSRAFGGAGLKVDGVTPTPRRA